MSAPSAGRVLLRAVRTRNGRYGYIAPHGRTTDILGLARCREEHGGACLANRADHRMCQERAAGSELVVIIREVIAKLTWMALRTAANHSPHVFVAGGSCVSFAVRARSRNRSK
jgi:hypothetical protein